MRLPGDEQQLGIWGQSNADAVKDRGAQTALEGAGAEWRVAARKAIEELARAPFPFTAEDVRRLAGDPPSDNAMGGALLRARKDGRIRMVGFAAARRLRRHGGTVRTWVGVEWTEL